MQNYTFEQLRQDGPPFAMAMLLRCISNGEPFVTYGSLREELQYQLEIDNIFPAHLGEPAGALMELILEIDPAAPLINVLITRPNGIPGRGAGPYLAARYNQNRLKKWDELPKAEKKKIVSRERLKIVRYKNWDAIFSKLFTSSAKKKLRPLVPPEQDYSGRRYGGPAESKEHKKLKEWVAADPTRIGLSRKYGKGRTEYDLLSGDKVDVMFFYQDSYRAVEVKSIRSPNSDFERGIYQCVKYKEVKIAELAPNDTDVQAILVTERKLPNEKKLRARILGIKLKVVSVNKPSYWAEKQT